jgi:hypothetical protein
VKREPKADVFTARVSPGPFRALRGVAVPPDVDRSVMHAGSKALSCSIREIPKSADDHVVGAQAGRSALLGTLNRPPSHASVALSVAAGAGRVPYMMLLTLAGFSGAVEQRQA